jgi:catechol-2,3-dioxygenase
MTQPIGPLNFILLYSSDIAKARAFYVDVLGMAVESETPAFVQVTASGEPGLSLALTAREPDVATTGRTLSFADPDSNILSAFRPRS